MVETVRGPVDAAALGTTLMHEHVFVLTPDLLANYGHEYWDEELRVADAVEQARPPARARASDDRRPDRRRARPRHPPRRAGQRRGRPQHRRRHRPLHLRRAPPPAAVPRPGDPARRRGTDDRRCSCATSARASPGPASRRRSSRASSRRRASPPTRNASTGPSPRPTARPACRSPSTPTPSTGPARLALDLYEAEGVDLTKVVVGHAGDSNDLDYLRALADRGATLGCDRFGLDRFNPTDRRVATVAALCAQGYADRIVLSHDASCYIDFYAGDQAQQALRAGGAELALRAHQPRRAPRAARAGVSDEQITTMLVDNPRRHFAPR